MSTRIGILVVSDGVSSGNRQDKSGAAIAAWAKGRQYQVSIHAVVADVEELISAALEEWIEGRAADVILTTGGTGFSSRDVTPEATWAVIDREAPGIAEAIRAAGVVTTPMAMLSRGIAGITNQILIVNLPGSVAGVKDGLEVLNSVIDHAVKILHDETEH